MTIQRFLLTSLILSASLSNAVERKKDCAQNLEVRGPEIVWFDSDNSGSHLSDISEAVRVQRTLLRSYGSVLPDDRGFLTIPLDESAILRLMKTCRGTMLVAKVEDRVVGYLLLTDGFAPFESQQFMASAPPDDIARLAPAVEIAKYIWQIGVDREFGARGVGRALVAMAMQLSPQGLTAEVMAAPQEVSNPTSFRLLTRSGFQKLGETLHPPWRQIPVPFRKHFLYWPGAKN